MTDGVMFAVMKIAKQVDIQILGKEHSIPLSFADGMLGAMPVFETRAQAEEYAGESAHVYAVVAKD